MKFFKEENHRIIVDPEIKVIKEFRNLIAKDKDREKREALKWFAFIFYMNDYRSPFFNYAESERHKRVCRSVQLPEDFKPFKEITEATKTYNEFQQTATVKTLKAIKDGLITSSRVIELIKTQIDTLLETGDIDSDELDSITKNVTRMLDLADKLPKAIKTITVLEEEVKKEQSGDSKIRGGGTKGHFED